MAEISDGRFQVVASESYVSEAFEPVSEPVIGEIVVAVMVEVVMVVKVMMVIVMMVSVMMVPVVVVRVELMEPVNRRFRYTLKKSEREKRSSRQSGGSRMRIEKSSNTFLRRIPQAGTQRTGSRAELREPGREGRVRAVSVERSTGVVAF